MYLIPLFVNLHHKKIVLAGGGTVAARKLQKLLPFHHNITIVSPEISSIIQNLIDQYQIQWIKARCQLSHMTEADVIIIATNDPATNQYLAEHAPEKAWVNASHQAHVGNLQFPITINKGRLQVAISTGGASPILAQKIKQTIEEQIPDSYEQYIDFLYQARITVRTHIASAQKRQELLQAIVDEPIFSTRAQQDWLDHVAQMKSM
ncbi:precorrin-2 dehydrogenase/sirohydrochlorin ferrochelatase family protein [Gracilibacillus phocaeensis]|uniref:precorrin-2 dehydrogenase/sirohydrochlorin ferrochelatase family protein n=1 Tax=Gracilibacillus phocaeensis TaxID=2042304 RepID=UPI001030B624|nr:NAD(P)-dependent oxidoreductase [Gracilibacillus phocaeensis]